MQFQRFDSKNSPLPSDNIIDIAIEPQSGEVFFLTDQGIMSYRSDATLLSERPDEVKIFPNPIRPQFQGMVGISGLANNAVVKITDIKGRLIKELRAFGNSASWDLTDFKGRRPANGVYLILSTDDEGGEGVIGKLAIVNYKTEVAAAMELVKVTIQDFVIAP